MPVRPVKRPLLDTCGTKLATAIMSRADPYRVSQSRAGLLSANALQAGDAGDHIRFLVTRGREDAARHAMFGMRYTILDIKDIKT